MRSNLPSRILLCAGGFAAVLLGFRIYTLVSAVGADGLLPRGSWVLPATTVLCVLCFLTLSLLCLGLTKKPGTIHCLARGGHLVFFQLLAGFLLSLGSLYSLLQTDETVGILVPVTHLLGIVCGGSMVLVAFANYSAGRGTFWPQAGMSVYTLIAMVVHFQSWSHEPLVIDIIPLLLALICDMVCVMLLSGFALRVGHRRSSVSFGLCAGIFTFMALPDIVLRTIGAGEILIFLSLGMWCIAHALLLLRHEQRRRPRDIFGLPTEAPVPKEEAPASAEAQTGSG